MVKFVSMHGMPFVSDDNYENFFAMNPNICSPNFGMFVKKINKAIQPKRKKYDHFYCVYFVNIDDKGELCLSIDGICEDSVKHAKKNPKKYIHIAATSMLAVNSAYFASRGVFAYPLSDSDIKTSKILREFFEISLNKILSRFSEKDYPCFDLLQNKRDKTKDKYLDNITFIFACKQFKKEHTYEEKSIWIDYSSAYINKTPPKYDDSSSSGFCLNRDYCFLDI